MQNIFTAIRKAMFPTPEERFDAGFKYGQEHFAGATTFDALDMLYDALPIESGDKFDEGVKAAYRERNTKLGDIDHTAHRIRPPVAQSAGYHPGMRSEKPAWAQGVDILNLKVGDPCIINVKKHADGSDEIVSFTELKNPLFEEIAHAQAWRTLMGIKRAGRDMRGKPKYRGPSWSRRI